ncbi:M1 family metallopeptidase [Sphingomonas sp.]|jgi:aminopeptidase N|uniref:M1 family metallopeptidase n=1 Tax=Sphingomonas sp. TaxID=28214 RepID=UPI002D80E11E|nr:M1 family metallopeptidase [Sphingomonas sp.]HEU0043629.1 M1 family metallopeptidase [Sphingomonas sp.]
MLRFALPALALLTAADLPKKGEPPLTVQTMRSGGAVDPEQAKLRFDAADLAFEIIPETRRLHGVATLTFSARTPLSALTLDLDRNLPVTAVTVDGAALPAASWSNPQGRLVIRLPRPLPAGKAVTARITYAGTPHIAVNAPWNDGVVWSAAPDKRLWFATTAQGYGCDLFWPCLDFPTGEPATVTLHITIPKGLKAPGNGVLLGVDSLPDGRTTWHWRARQPNTYAIALQVGPYDELRDTYRSRYGNTIPLHFWHLPGKPAEARALLAEFAPTLDFFEAVIGPYPFGDEKVGVVETPHLGMEHQTINAYGNAYAKAPEGFDWLFHHEFAHEWFGNQLTARDWDDYWLHEGFATYMQPLYGRWREGEARYAAMMAAQRDKIANKAPMVRDRAMSGDDVYEEARGGPGGDIYYKGSWILHTLRGLIGDRAFFSATRLLVYGRTDPEPGNFTPRYGSTRELQAAVRRVTGDDYDWFFDAYLRQPGLPELVEARVGDRLSLRWQVTGGKPFPMPVDVQVDGRTQRLAMSDGTGSLVLRAGSHVVVDPWAKILRRSVAIERTHAWRAKPKP